MSFRCQQCNNVDDRPNRLVIERKMVKHIPGEIPKGPRGGVGSQIVREIVVCDACKETTVEAPIERAEAVETNKKQIVPGVTFNGLDIVDDEHAA